MTALSLQDFAAAANQGFDLALGETTVALTLVEATPLPPQPVPGMMRAPFSLIFRSASQLILPQKIYRLTNVTMGALDIFLVPIARDTHGVLYQAVFN